MNASDTPRERGEQDRPARRPGARHEGAGGRGSGGRGGQRGPGEGQRRGVGSRGASSRGGGKRRYPDGDGGSGRSGTSDRSRGGPRTGGARRDFKDGQRRGGGEDRERGGRPYSRGDGQQDRGRRPYQGEDDRERGRRPYKGRDGREGGGRSDNRGDGQQDRGRRPYRDGDDRQRGERPYDRGDNRERGGRPYKGRDGREGGGRSDNRGDGRQNRGRRPYQGGEDRERGRRPYQDDDRRSSRSGSGRGSGGYQRDDRRSRPDDSRDRGRGYGSGQGRDRRPSRRDGDDEREPRQFPPGLEPAANEPELPIGYDEVGLPVPLRAELRGVSKHVASKVGGHLRAAGELIDIDPELALRHAMVARRLASRLPAVREVTAEVAYVAGDFETALTEYRALLRMSGNDDYLPVIADCERAVGKHQNALRTLAQARQGKLSQAQQTELVLVEAGTRNDMGQRAEASRLLKQAISSREGGREGQARLRFAYAELLAELGEVDAARQWLQSARKYDDNDELRIADRIAELDGQPPVTSEYSDEFEIMDVETAEEPVEDDDPEPQEDQ